MGRIEETIDRLFRSYDKHKNIYKLVEDSVIESDYSIRYNWQLDEWVRGIQEYKQRRLDKDFVEVQASGSTWQKGE